uniref:Uncharacterized protein n=1 Tax=Anguilla anguilla TaxID=7936 RepID=A0A0E9VVE3_ANGAN
MAYTEEYSKS